MNAAEDDILARAAAWHAASGDDAMDWDGLTRWLEADPRHAAAYNQIALADALLAEHRTVLRRPAPMAAALPDIAVPAPRRAPRRWAPWAGAALAASLVALLAVPAFLRDDPQDDAQTYRTQGAARPIALADGSQVLLAPHSRLTVSGHDGRSLALSGGAWFDIRHDPARQLVIRASGSEISDIGTRFDVQATGRQLRLEVAEGRVSVASPALTRKLALGAGRQLRFDGEQGLAVIRPVAVGNIGEWRTGRLTYEATPLPLVAADLSRYAGLDVDVADAVRDRRFSGTLIIRDGEAALRDLSQLMGLRLVRAGRGYRLVAAG